MQSVTRVCRQCQAVLVDPKSRRCFCNQACRMKHFRAHANYPTRICEACQQPFRLYVSHLRFCSNECSRTIVVAEKQARIQAVMTVCDECGIEFPKRSNNSRFCNLICTQRFRYKERQRNGNEYFHWLKRYGINRAVYLEMLAAQNGVCAICLRPPRGKRKSLGVDHDHSTGEIRALLCSNCNFGIGMFEDNPELLQKAIDYLKKG